jgi:hypothetical protein
MPGDDHRTRIIFITRDIDKEVIEETMRVFERRGARKSKAGVQGVSQGDAAEVVKHT